VTDAPGNEGRDTQGRFAVGNPGGPGNPGARQATKLRQTVQTVISPQYVAAMMRKAVGMALQGDLGAMRFVMDRALGRAGEEMREPETLAIDLPRMRTAADCSLAVERITEAICRGAIGDETARLLIDAIQTRLKAIEVIELEARLVELEKAAGSVDKGVLRRA
jgi:hypothetical protein